MRVRAVFRHPLIDAGEALDTLQRWRDVEILEINDRQLFVYYASLYLLRERMGAQNDEMGLFHELLWLLYYE